MRSKITDASVLACVTTPEAMAARIAALEATIVAMFRSIPGGTVCDPQVIAEELREIAKMAGVDVGGH